MLEELIGSIGTERFGSTAFAVLRREIAFQHLTINRYAECRPMELIAVECAGGANSFYSAIDHYMRGSYASDPLRSHYRGSTRTGFGLFSVNAEQVQNREVRKRLYSSIGIAGKLSLVIRRLHDALTLAVYRSQDDGYFDPTELNLMHSLSGTLAAAVERHVSISSSAPLNGLDELAKLVGETPGGRLLSKQEVAVCARIVAGYSTEAIALDLGVSPHSIATYRRRAYTKLHISSQNELFLLVLGLCCRRPKGIAQTIAFGGPATSAQRH